MLHVLVNYNFTPTWLLTSGVDYLIYDRSDSRDFLKDFDQSKIIVTENVGQVDWDKLSYLIDHYDTLPDVFLWGKTNLFKYAIEEDYKKAVEARVFAPLLRQDHPVHSDELGLCCFYDGGMYHERNPMLYFSDWKYCKSYPDFAQMFHLPSPLYIPFNPGGNFILTREAVHKYSRDFYDNMRSLLSYCRDPVEAHFAERSYYTMWK